MANLSFAEKSIASRNSMLTAKVCQVLSSYRRRKHLDPQEAAVLTRAAELLLKILRGSLLIENRPAELDGLSPSPTGLHEYIQALSALPDISKDANLTNVFMAYRKDITALAQGQHLEERALNSLEQFFDSLSERFLDDFKDEPEPSGRLNVPAFALLS